MIKILSNGWVSPWSRFCLIFFLFLFGSSYSYTFGLPKFSMYIPSNSVYIGRVHGRSIVKDEATGLPLWATYNKEGGHTELSISDLERASKGKVVSATFLNNYYSQLVDFRARYDGEIELLNTEEYKTHGSFQTQDGTAIIGLPELNIESGQFAIALPKKSKRFNFNGSRIETIIFPFDVKLQPKIKSNTLTVLVDENGEFMEESPERIGYLSAFVLGEDGKVAPSAEYDQYEGAMTNLFQREVLNPVAGVRITGENGMTLNQESYTDLGGAYRLQMRFGCPGGFFQTTTYLDAHMSYGMFTPRGVASMPYWISFPAIDNCIGYIDPRTGISTARDEVTRVNFQVAISVLTGTAILWNAEISDAAPTAFHAEQSSEELTSIVNDYDGDHLIDGTTQGLINDDGFFEASTDGEIYGVFLSGSPREDGQPNFTRVMDVKANTTSQGLVSAINKNDMRNTDIYAFRESTGELLTERIGIPKDEEKLMVIGGHSEGLTANGQFTYTFAIRSPEDMLSMHSKRHDGWEAWQADNKINPALHSRQSDFIRTGEQIRIVAINRATGYMGSSLATMGGTSGGGDLTVYVPPLVLGPPNLKVWATRRYQPQGLLKNSEKERNTISNEGAATTGDYVIEVHTQWLDHNDQPLPDELQGRGFTGRLVKVVSDDGAFETKVTEFPINPGRHMQVMKFNEGQVGKAHFYLQVNGKIEAAENDFSSGAHTGVLAHRPSLYVPIKVPLYNEQETKLNAYLQKKAEAANGEQNEEDKFKEEPIFDWVYRPELSFSVVDLEVQEILREQEDEEGNTTVSLNIMEDDTPTISSTDDLIKVMFELAESEYDRITPLDGEQEYIFAIGEQEISITLTEHKNSEKEITFSNLEHLAEIEPEDYLSLRLYLNQDSQNVLWEFAFNFISISVLDDDVLQNDVAYVSADDSSIELVATVYGYASADDEVKSKMPQKIQWKVISGNATITPRIATVDETGNATVSVYVSPYSNNKVKIEAVPLETTFKNEVHMEIAVIPGKPATVKLSEVGGTAFLKGRGTVQVEALVKDQYGNLVVNGTGVHFREQGHINVKRTTGITDAGIVRADISAGSVAGSFPLKASSGFAESSMNISAQKLDVEIIGLPNELVAGQKYNLTARLSGTNEDLSGIYVDLGSSAGAITAMDLTTDSNGDVGFTYKAPQVLGQHQLAAKVDIENPYIEKLTVVAASQKLKPEHYFMVAGADDLGSSISRYDGTQSQLSYPASNILTLSGSAGSNWSINLDDKHLVNREPLYFNRFTSGGWDELRQHQAELENITRFSTQFDGIGAIKFSRLGADGSAVNGSWELEEVVGAESEQPAFNFWLLPDGNGEVLDVAGGAIEVVHSGSTLTASLKVKLADQTFATRTLELPVTDHQWQAVAVGVKAGQFYLAVDAQEVFASVGGTIHYTNTSSSWLTLGNNYAGQVAGLRIYNWLTSALVEVAGNTSGVFDNTGIATVNLALSSSAQQSISMPSVSVAIIQVSDGEADSTVLNVLSKAVVEKLAASYFAVNTSSTATAETVLQQMPMDELFPAATSGARTLVQRFAASKNSESAKENALVNMAWLSHNTRFESLHTQVNTLQRYIADSQHPHLASFANEYLQEATVQAAQGNNFWLRSMATSLTVWAELIDTNPAMANIVAQAIENRGDFWLWSRVMSLPADGWATDSIPIPRPDVTCDTVSRDVNVGTPLAYASTPCRATGQQLASMMNVLLDVDPGINNDPALMTLYMSTLLSALKQMPLEYKRIFPPIGNQVASRGINFSLFPQAHAAGPLVYGFRMIAIALKQGLRKGLGGGPANFIAFLQGGTTSRVDPVEMLTALAYLGSRLEGVECDGCEMLNDQVSNTIEQDMGTWFAGIALSKKGSITQEDLTKRSCTLTGNTHGKAFELLATAAYHALYEFGGDDGLKYKILQSDPREKKDIIKVGLMYEDAGVLKNFGEHQRKPDLVLEGAGKGQRKWVELKSWGFNNQKHKRPYYNQSSQRLYSSVFPLWDGIAHSDKLKYSANAHRQHFLDYAASKDMLTDDYWEDKPFKDMKPASHVTWMQIWKPGVRSWKHLYKDGNKWFFEKKETHRSVSNTWIDEAHMTKGIVTTVSPQFKALQRYLTTAPTKLRDDVFEASVGHKSFEHEEKYTKKQVSDTEDKLKDSSVKPFTLANFFALELGESAGKKLKQKMLDEFGDSDLADMQKAIDSGELSQEQIEVLRQNIFDHILESLGPIQYLAVDVPGLSWIENGIADLVMGDDVEKLRQWITEVDFPEEQFENLCEAR